MAVNVPVNVNITAQLHPTKMAVAVWLSNYVYVYGYGYVYWHLFSSGTDLKSLVTRVNIIFVN